MYDQKLSSITIYYKYKKQACKIYQSQSTYHLESNKFYKSSEFHIHKHMCKGYLSIISPRQIALHHSTTDVSRMQT